MIKISSEFLQMLKKQHDNDDSASNNQFEASQHQVHQQYNQQDNKPSGKKNKDQQGVKKNTGKESVRNRQIRDPNKVNNNRHITEQEHQSLIKDYNSLVKEYDRVLVELRTLRKRQTSTESNMKKLEDDYRRMYDMMYQMYQYIENMNDTSNNKKASNKKANSNRKAR